MKNGKKARLLPTRGGRIDLDKSQHSVADYAKALPRTGDPTPNVIQMLRKGK